MSLPLGLKMFALAPTQFSVLGACRVSAGTRSKNRTAMRATRVSADTPIKTKTRGAFSNRRGHAASMPQVSTPRRASVVCAAAPIPPPAVFSAVSPWATLLAALPSALEANVKEFAAAAVFLTACFAFLPALARRLWTVLHRVYGNGTVSAMFPIRSFSVTDAELGGKLRSKARELASFETSWIAAAVRPVQIALVATVFTRLLVVTKFSVVVYKLLYARVGCVVHTWKLPWPVYVASAWWFLDNAIKNQKHRALVAVDAVGHAARALEPRITTGASTARTAIAIPMILLWLDTVGVTLSSVWGLLGFGGVAVSLGLKDLVADFIAGLMMLTNPTFKVGDNIKAGAVMGTVLGIGATKTTLLTRTGTGKTPHTISNNVLSSHSAGLVNMSLSRARYFDHVICVDAKSMDSLEKLCAEVSDYLVNHPLVILDPMDSGEKPWCALSKLGPHGVLIGVKCCLRKMGGQAFALEQGRMLIDIGKIVEKNEGVELDVFTGIVAA